MTARRPPAKKPAVKKPVAKKPVAKKPAVRASAGKAPGAKASVAKQPRSHADTSEAVDEFMRSLSHPLKAALEQVRSVILSSSSGIAEVIKWKSPSFRVQGAADYFATVNINDRAKPRHFVHLILHQGVKARDNGPGGLKLRDPEGLLEWLAADRAAVRFMDAPEVAARRSALQDIIRQWMRYL